MRAALRQERLLLAFQPVVCSATGKVDYFECLLRMRDEQGDIVAAAKFVTTLEDLGLIGMIDRYVLEMTFEELAADPEVRLGLNVSGLTVCDPSWLRSLKSLLRRRADLASRLVVEITETAALGDIAESARFVDTAASKRAAALRSTISAPAIRRCGICGRCRYRSSRSTVRLSAR